MPRLAFSDWTVEQLRCTAFVTLPGNPATAAHWWTLLADADPEQITSNPRLGSSQAVGSFGPRTLVVSTQADRVDWFLAPIPIEATSVHAPEITEPRTPSIGFAPEAFDVFSELSNRWLTFEDIPGVSRLALGGVFTHQEDDQRTAYQKLPDYLPVQVDPDSSDFLFQINHPIQSRSGIEGLVINRLSKWAVTMFKLFTLNVTGGSFAQQQNTTIALRTEIDINTVPEFEGELPKDRLIEIFAELIDQGRSLITNGVSQE
jgi:hypothetical protein